jgi:mannose-6-phosphate isomerase-like protein (cupin superfamily)
VHRIIPAGELTPSPNRTLRFEGADYGSGVSFFLVDAEAGQGPGLHRHPYSETWIVRSGSGVITADGESYEVGPGDIAVVGPDTPHKFVAVGSGRLELVCIHASPRMIQEELEDDQPG